MRKLALGFVVLAVSLSASAEEITLPAAASIVGVAPFFSDVRAFNTSYTAPLDVTARYRCFIPSPCTGVGQAQIQFTLAPRESHAFDNIVELTFLAPNTAGGVEFDFSGDSSQLVVTSRLYSTAPVPTVGMFIPGLKNSEAHARSVLTSVRNGGAGSGFRTNVGVFNREDSSVDVTFTIFEAGVQLGTPVTRTVAGHSGAQVNALFTAAGQGGHATQNAVILVSSSGEVFSYAAVIDNATTDPIFVRGAEDRDVTSAPGGGGGGGATTVEVEVGSGGTTAFRDDRSQGTTTEIHVGDTVKWVWDASGSMMHGVTPGTCTPGGYYGDETCDSDGGFAAGLHQGAFQFSHTFATAGSFPYYCPAHGYAMRGRVVVTAPGPASGSVRKPS